MTEQTSHTVPNTTQFFQEKNKKERNITSPSALATSHSTKRRGRAAKEKKEGQRQLPETLT
jgi:hypothetical protein